MLWMKDLIEHMNRCNEQLQWADSRTQSFLTESLMTSKASFRQVVMIEEGSRPDAGDVWEQVQAPQLACGAKGGDPFLDQRRRRAERRHRSRCVA